MAILLINCNEKQSIDNVLFPKYEFINTDSLIFEKLDKKKIHFTKNVFFKYKVGDFHDTLIGYWGLINDTVYFISQDKFEHKIFNGFPMLSYNSKINDTYNIGVESDFYSYIISVELMNIEILDNDTLYFVKHSCYPSDFHVDFIYTDSSTGNKSVKAVRKYLISKNRGVIDYSFEKFNEDFWFVEFPYYPR